MTSVSFTGNTFPASRISGLRFGLRRASRAQLDHRFLSPPPLPGHPAGGGLRCGRRGVTALPGHRRLPRHHPRPGADQHHRPGPGAGGGRAAHHLPGRAEPERAAGPPAGALGVQVRPVPGGRHLRGRYRHLLCAEPDQRTAEHGGDPRGGRPPEDGAGGDRPGRGLSLRRHRAGQRRHRPARSTTGSSSRSCGRSRARPRSTAGAATRSSTWCASTRSGSSSTT